MHAREPGQIPSRFPRARSLLLVSIVVAASLLASGCMTRINRHSIIERRAVQVDLVTEREGLFDTVSRDYQHPAILSQERATHILNAIEVETPQDKGGFIRQPAIHPELVEEAAIALVEGFAKAGPDEDLAVKLIRKEASLGIFHTKYLTSFIAYMKDGYLYILLSRVDWPIPQARENEKLNKLRGLPEPRRDQQPMDFRVVSGEHVFYAGPQALEIAWQNPVFQTAYRLPGTSGGEAKRREVLFQAPAPPADRNPSAGDGVALDQLTSDQLRALADLEDDRREGRITENAYQRAKRDLLRSR